MGAVDTDSSFDEVEQLKELLLSEELSELTEKLENISKQEHIAHHLPDAVSNAHLENTSGLSESLQEPLIKALEVGGRENCKPLSEALFPILGPAIRYYVKDTFQGMFEQLNESISNATSIKRLKWFVEAKLTGKDVSEYILLKTLNYEVENILLVNPTSGLLMQQVAKNEEDKADSELVSSMLVAIRSFIKDSFSSHHESTEELGRFSFGEKDIYLESGPNAILAVVALGNLHPDYRSEMEQAVETIHAQAGSQLENFSGDMSDLESVCQPVLNELLVESKAQESKKSSKLPGIMALVAVAGLIAWPIVTGIKNNILENRVRKQAAVEPGIELISFDSPMFRKGQVKLLRDPSAQSIDEFFANANVSTDWRQIRTVPFQSMDPVFAGQREAFLVALESTQKAQQKQLNQIAVQRNRIAELETYITNLPFDRISAVNNHKINTLEKQLYSTRSTFESLVETDFFKRFPVQESAQLTYIDGSWTLKGDVPEPYFSRLTNSENPLIDGSDLVMEEITRTLPGRWMQMKSEIEAQTINYLNSSSKVSKAGYDARSRLHSLVGNLEEWYGEYQLSGSITLHATPITGENHQANQLIVNQRLEIEKYILKEKFPSLTILTNAIKTAVNQRTKGVYLEIHEPDW